MPTEKKEKPVQAVRNDVVTMISSKPEVSDIHLIQDDYVMYRINGEIARQTQRLQTSKEWMDQTLSVLLNNDPARVALFHEKRELDFGYLSADGVNYRVNAYTTRNKIWIALRKINNIAKNLWDLIDPMIAQAISESILSKKAWLFLVTWATWAGKSTTIVAMLEYLNQHRNSHIITIEDPIEFVFTAKSCMISQREVWWDTLTFANALRSAMREDPNIIFIWEIRDKETADTAIHMAETWHLVFSTLHTNSASSTVNRFLWFFEPEIQQMIADRLSDVLLWAISQHLVYSPKLWHRIWMYEFMINNVAIRNHIKRRELPQIDSAIETNLSQWMVSMRMYAKKLIDQWLILPDAVQRLAAQQS